MMKEQYQNELSQIRAPKDLIEKTKLVMKEEEAKKSISFSQKVNIKWAVAVAASVVLIATVSVSTLINWEMKVDNPIQLAAQEQHELIDIEKTSEMSFGELTIKKTDKTTTEIQGNNIVEHNINGIQVKIYTNVITGCYQCFFEKEEQNYVISSEITELEVFKNEIEGYMKQIN